MTSPNERILLVIYRTTLVLDVSLVKESRGVLKTPSTSVDMNSSFASSRLMRLPAANKRRRCLASSSRASISSKTYGRFRRNRRLSLLWMKRGFFSAPAATTQSSDSVPSYLIQFNQFHCIDPSKSRQPTVYCYWEGTYRKSRGRPGSLIHFVVV